MTKQIFLFLSTLTALFVSSCKSTLDLTEDEVYTILNEIIADDSLSIYSVCWKFQEITITDEYRKEFTQKDILFINRQREIFKNLHVKPNKLKWYKRRGKTIEYTTIDSACNEGILYHVSFPLIAADKQKVMIEFQEDCNCLLGGQGGIDLYEKKNGHWVCTKGFDHWISESKKVKGRKQLLATRV